MSRGARLSVFLGIGVMTLALQSASAQSADDYLTEANQLVAENQLKEALRLLQEATSKYQNDSELRLRFAQLLVRAGNARSAVEMLRPVLAVSGADVDTLTCLGDAETALGEHAAASQAFEAALKFRPGSASLLQKLAQALFFAGKQKEALAAARQALESGSPTGEGRRLYAFLLTLDGQVNEAYRQQRAALAEDPRNARLLYELSESRRVAKRYSDALEYVELAIDADPENPLYHSSQARLYRLLKQAGLAQEAERRADSLLSAFKVYAECVNLAAAGDVDKAISLLGPAVDANLDFLSGQLLLADLEARRGHDERALELYQAATRQSPLAQEAREKIAWLRVRKGDLAAALDLLEDSPQSTLNSSLTRGYFYMSRGRWADALKEFEFVEMRHPLNYQLLKLISACLRELGRPDEALARLDKARAIRPDDQEITTISRSIRFEQALAALQAEQWPGAIRMLSQLVSEEPGQSEYLLRLAFARDRSGDLEGAARDYYRGLGLDEDSPWARKNLAICLTRLGRFREAATEWQSVCRADDSAENLLQLGLCQSQLERYDQAEKAFQAALGKTPDSAELLYNLGATKIRLNKLEEGWDLVRQASRRGYGPARDLLAKAARRR